jgi:hypothetical protein
VYFDGDPLNDADGILGGVRPEDRPRVLVKFAPVARGSDRLEGAFEIVLGPAGARGTTPRLE